MTRSDFLAMLPLLVTGYAGVALMVIVAFRRGRAAAYYLTLVSLAGSLACVFVALPYTPRTVTPLIRMDRYSLYFAGLIIIAAFLVTLLSHDYLKARERPSHAYYVLLILGVLGMETLAASAHFASFFLGLEILSVSLYGLIGYARLERGSLEAAIKYLIMASSSSTFLLFGIALVYADLGTMDFAAIGPLLSRGGPSIVSLFGLALIIAGIGFKLAIVPFHMWSPDVYQGASAPVTALVATGSKGAVFALLLRLVTIGGLGRNSPVFVALGVLAIATMFAGNLLALLQTNVKRLLAY